MTQCVWCERQKPDEEFVPCLSCDGKKMLPCDECNGLGTVVCDYGHTHHCPACYGTKQMHCEDCNGTGISDVCKTCDSSWQCHLCGEVFDTDPVRIGSTIFCRTCFRKKAEEVMAGWK